MAGGGGWGERQRDSTTGIHDDSERPMGALHRNKGGEEEKRGAEGTGVDGRRLGYAKCKRPAVQRLISHADGRCADGVHSSPGATCMHSDENAEF